MRRGGKTAGEEMLRRSGKRGRHDDVDDEEKELYAEHELVVEGGARVFVWIGKDANKFEVDAVVFWLCQQLQSLRYLIACGTTSVRKERPDRGASKPSTVAGRAACDNICDFFKVDWIRSGREGKAF